MDRVVLGAAVVCIVAPFDSPASAHTVVLPLSRGVVDVSCGTA
jgi:hypothetical protein